MKKILFSVLALVIVVGISSTIGVGKTYAFSGSAYTTPWGSTNYYFNNGVSGSAYTTPWGSTNYYFSDGTSGSAYTTPWGSTNFYFNNPSNSYRSSVYDSYDFGY